MLASVLTDWIIALGSAFGAAATLAAVIVALFGPQWRNRRIRPRLAVDAEVGRGSVVVGSPEESPFFIPVTINNEPGRATARDVEVTATVSEVPNEKGGFFSIPDVPLSFSPPWPDGAPQTVTHIAPGHHRTAYLLGLGGKPALATWLSAMPDGLFEPDEDYGIAVASPQARYLLWLDPDQSFDVTLIVTGSNFDAIRFKGRLSVTTERADEDGEPDPSGDVSAMAYDWTRRLSPDV
jgi:hypothetical protein